LAWLLTCSCSQTSSQGSTFVGFVGFVGSSSTWDLALAGERAVFHHQRKNLEMDKAQLIKQIVASLSQSLGVLEKAARASHAEATHESSKAESKYDTRGLEAAYLAGGQARQAKEILDSIKVYETLTTRDFAPHEPIDLTALVELDAGGTRSVYFIGPRNGGLEIEHQSQEITVITSASPLVQNLMGKRAGQRWTAKLGRSVVIYHIVSVA
jgi:transcription elongation GreA/GreB family factor